LSSKWSLPFKEQELDELVFMKPSCGQQFLNFLVKERDYFQIHHFIITS
jgi:hypothetical protein